MFDRCDRSHAELQIPEVTSTGSPPSTGRPVSMLGARACSHLRSGLPLENLK
jgi:hypothetical protein